MSEESRKYEHVPFPGVVRVKTEQNTEIDSETDRHDLDGCNSESSKSPKRRFSRDGRTSDEEEETEPPLKITRDTESPNGHANRKLHPNPLDLLSRAFPNHCKSVLEMVLQGCNGNVVQAIECLLTHQEKSKPLMPIPMPLLAGYPRDVHRGIHPPLMYKDSFPHTFHQAVPVNCRFPPPPPLFKPKVPGSPGFGFAMETILTRPPVITEASKAPKADELNKIRFCTHCGKKVNNNDNFCACCGRKLC